MDDDERRKRAAGEGAAFMTRIRATMPEHAVLYCDHASYIGFNGLFKDQCERCTLPNCGHDMAVLKRGDMLVCPSCSNRMETVNASVHSA